jgi:hypothetical protein
MGIALAVVLLAAIVLPGIIKDNIVNNLNVELNPERLSSTLRAHPPKVPLKIRNGGWFGIKIESLKFDASLLGARLSSSCVDGEIGGKEIPSGDRWTDLDIPLCLDFDTLKGQLEHLPDFDQSAVHAALTAKILGMTVHAELPSTTVLPDEVIKSAFHLKERAVESPANNADPKPHSASGGGSHKAAPRDNTDVIMCPDGKTPKPPSPATCKDVMGATGKIKDAIEQAQKDAIEAKKRIVGKGDK